MLPVHILGGEGMCIEGDIKTAFVFVLSHTGSSKHFLKDVLLRSF
jgi:hypothetical protein